MANLVPTKAPPQLLQQSALQSKIEQRRAIAKALMAVQMPQGQMAGRFYAAPSPWAQALAGVTNVIGQVQGGKADEMQRGADAEKQAAVAKALAGMFPGGAPAGAAAGMGGGIGGGVPGAPGMAGTGGMNPAAMTTLGAMPTTPVAPGAPPAPPAAPNAGGAPAGVDPNVLAAIAAMTPDQQSSMLANKTNEILTAKPAELKWQNVGNEMVGLHPTTGEVVKRVPIGIDPKERKLVTDNVGGSLEKSDPYSGDVVASIDKTVSPDAQLSANTALTGQRLSANTALSGQNSTANTARMSDLTARRGQDIQKETALKNAGIKGLTESQAKAASQLTRMTGAEENLGKLSVGGFGPEYADQWMDKTPGGINNLLTSSDYQLYKQAANEWIAGLLRLDSGAAVPETEFARYFQTWFPQPGEGEDVVKQKTEARQRAMEGMRIGLPAGLQIGGQAAPPPGNTGGSSANWEADPRAAGAEAYLQ